MRNGTLRFIGFSIAMSFKFGSETFCIILLRRVGAKIWNDQYFGILKIQIF